MCMCVHNACKCVICMLSCISSRYYKDFGACRCTVIHEYCFDGLDLYIFSIAKWEHKSMNDCFNLLK